MMQNTCRVGVNLDKGAKALLTHAANAYGMTKRECYRSLFKFLGKDAGHTHPVIMAGLSKRKVSYILDITPEEVKLLDAEAARLKSSRARVLRLLLNHLTEFTPADIPQELPK